MDRNSFIAAFSIPALILLHVLWQFIVTPPTEGWGGIALTIELMFGIIAAVLVGITLFVLRRRNLLWWHWLLISIASLPVAIGLLVLLTRIIDGYASLHQPVYQPPTGPGTKSG